MHLIYFMILFTRAPLDSRAVLSDGTTLVWGLLFILNKRGHYTFKLKHVDCTSCKYARENQKTSILNARLDMWHN